jgi:histidinol-phosphate aminotransferase
MPLCEFTELSDVMSSVRGLFDKQINGLDILDHTPVEHIRKQYHLEHLHGLAYNESAFGASPDVVEAIRTEADSVGRYPFMRDTPLRETLVNVFNRDNLTPAHFLSACSGCDVMYLITQALLQPGDDVLTVSPSFLLYDRLAVLRNTELKTVPLDDATFALDVDALLDAITDKTRLLFLCNPNNPTGTYFPADQVQQIVERLPAHVILIADEVYAHFATAPDFPQTLDYVLDGRNVIITHTFSKAYGLAGMRLGYAIGSPELLNYIARFARPFQQTRLQVAAALAALRDRDHLQKNIDAAVNGRRYLYEHLDRLDVRYWRSQTNFVLADLARPAKPVAESMLKQGVMIRPAPNGLSTYIRISTGTPKANEACINALEHALKETG